jgi:diphosphomevalonate decarboxylase
MSEMLDRAHRKATAVANPNIAFIKYWGNRDDALRLPANGSISMTLGGLETRTTVDFDPELSADELAFNDSPTPKSSLERVVSQLDHIRSIGGISTRARVISRSNFPSAAGIASSAAAFAALTVAGCAAAGVDLPPQALSRIARRGSGSASRSIHGGFVEWHKGTNDGDSFSEAIAAPDHWELVDLIAIVSRTPKAVGSTEGHARAGTSPLQAGRIADAPRRLELCRQAILTRDFDALARVAEQDSNMMHSVMMTCEPPVYYLTAETIRLMGMVREWRSSGAQVFFTIDAGPNVHCVCPKTAEAEIGTRLRDAPGVQQVLAAPVGGPARLVPADSAAS